MATLAVGPTRLYVKKKSNLGSKSKKTLIEMLLDRKKHEVSGSLADEIWAELRDREGLFALTFEDLCMIRDGVDIRSISSAAGLVVKRRFPEELKRVV